MHATTQYRAPAVGNLLRIALQDRCQALPGMASASLFGEGEPARLPCLRLIKPASSALQHGRKGFI